MRLAVKLPSLGQGIGAILILFGALVGLGWFVWLAPARKANDPYWRMAHTQKAYWEQVQSAANLGLWTHDDGFTVGFYGDKSWAEWIMKRTRPGDSMGCLGEGLCHASTSMSLITNQNQGGDADSWMEWWSENRSKSQLEWIADGFQEQGIEIAFPVPESQVPILLEILGGYQVYEGEFTSVPGHMEYNAFRCLRDSGFDAVEFALTEQPVPASVEGGLRVYSVFEKRWPSAAKVGRLPFAKPIPDLGGAPVPSFVGWKFKLIVLGLTFSLLLVGVILVVRMRRRKTE